MTMEDRNRTLSGLHSAHDQDQQTNYAFLVHSTSSVSNDQPGKEENTSSTRQKRRRTSPEDHAILEASYLKNCKPDKNERMEIVSQVSLGEKEVQIWFQNRRQNDRRKSRPLLPHELVPHFRNGVPEALQNSPCPDLTGREQRHLSISTPDLRFLSTTSRPSPLEDDRVLSRASSIHELLNPPSSVESSTPPHTQERVEPGTTPPSTLEQSQETQIQQLPPSKREDVVRLNSEESRSSSGRKRAHEEMAGYHRSQQNIPPTEISTPTAQVPAVRLSMTAEGSVKIRTTESVTPSPPKDRARPSATCTARISSGLQRSKSAIGPSEMSHTTPSPIIPKDNRLGRSRDARTWEFYCDSDARDTLSAHAEHERSGSAIGAINLIRSQSQRQRNQILTPVSSAKVSLLGPANNRRERSKLTRTKPSLARMQNVNGGEGRRVVAIGPKDNSKPELVRSPSEGDSDKENWAPGTKQAHHPLRRMHPVGNARGLLANNDQAGKSGAEKEREKPKGSDLDCVQGLLSLSQGAWR